MQGKVVVITGGNGTLGGAFAKGLAQHGANVFILGRNQEKSAAVRERLHAIGLKVNVVSCDVLDQESVDQAVTTVLEKAGKVDVLVNAAGGNLSGAVVMPDQSTFDLDVEQFRKVNDLNLMGTVIPSLAFAKPMVAQGMGSIINISSMAAVLPLTRVVGYSASKAALDNFTRWLSVEMAHKYNSAVRVNAIAPGFFVAEQNRSLLLKEDGSLTDRGNTIISQTPMKRFGEPEELLSTLLWLCDDKSAFVTGIIVPVDGGFSAFAGV